MIDRLFISDRSGRSKLLAALTVVVTALAAVLVAPQPAWADVWYYYDPSQMIERQPGITPCTGSWVFVSNSNNQPWIVTTGQCGNLGDSIYTGFSGANRIGSVVANLLVAFEPHDIALIKPDPGVDALQQIAGVGKVVGWRYVARGDAVAMKGAVSGLLYGTVTSINLHFPPTDEPVFCATFNPQPQVEDIGAPVFIHYGNQVYAVGVYIRQSDSQSCFLSIVYVMNILYARLPVFPEGTQ